MRKTSALAAVVVMTMAVGEAAAERGWLEPARQPETYVVSSARDSRVMGPSASPVVTPDAMPGAIPLVLVGSFLLGLAAAVRRTT